MDKSKQEHKENIENLIKELLTYIEEARNMSDHDCSLRGDYKNNPDLLYPQTRSEYIADQISTLLASNDWVNGEDESILDEMLGLAGQLSMDVSQLDVWHDLFELANRLRTK
jgi:hypothetical protein